MRADNRITEQLSKESSIYELPLEIQDMIRSGKICGGDDDHWQEAYLYVVYDSKYNFYKVAIGIYDSPFEVKYKFNRLDDGFADMLEKYILRLKWLGMIKSVSEIFIAFGCMNITDGDKLYCFDSKGNCSVYVR